MLASTSVLAEIQPGFYAGAGVGTATIELDELDGFKFDSDETAFKVFNLGSSFELRTEYENISISDGDFSLLTVNGLFKF